MRVTTHAMSVEGACEFKRDKNSVHGMGSPDRYIAITVVVGHVVWELNCHQCSNNWKGKKVSGEFVKCECC